MTRNRPTIPAHSTLYVNPNVGVASVLTETSTPATSGLGYEPRQLDGTTNQMLEKPADGFSKAKDSHIIHADLLIPGRGDPIVHASIVITPPKITWMGSTHELPSTFSSLPSTYVPVLMPGLWDCHCHLIGFKSLTLSSALTPSPATLGARLARGLHDILMSGFTSIRDLGGFAPEVRPAVLESLIPGPHIYSAGAALSQTAGHGDSFDLPSSWAYSRCSVGPHYQGSEVGVAPFVLADGVDECRRAVRLQLRRGADVIKVFASGGVLSIADDPLQQQFSDIELSTIVEEAARADRVVAAHVHGKKGILAALRAGVHTLEHGTYLDAECVALMKAQGTMLVATRTIVEEGVKHPELMDPLSYVKMVETAKHHAAAYALAVAHGVKIALGTDLGISVAGASLNLGNSGAEPGYAVAAGMSALQAIEAATANGPETLGPRAPQSGQIRVGYDADVIALVGSPLDDIKILNDVKNVTHVWKLGKLYKAPGYGGSLAWL